MFQDDLDCCDDFHHQLDFPLPQIGLNPQAREWFPEDNPHLKCHSRRFPRPTYRAPYDFYHRGRYIGHGPSYSPPNRFCSKDHTASRNSRFSAHTQQKQNKRKQRKFSYRSKQNKIDVVLNNLKRKFANVDKLADGEVLRGQDTLRIDVKRFTALQQIEKVIEDVQRDGEIEIVKADFPVSQKNRFQKKGFIAYLKCGNEEQAQKLHKMLSKLMDPKWQDKRLFRVNIALDQQRESFSSESSTKSFTRMEKLSGTDSASSESNLSEESLAECADFQLIAKEELRHKTWEHRNQNKIEGQLFESFDDLTLDHALEICSKPPAGKSISY